MCVCIGWPLGKHSYTCLIGAAGGGGEDAMGAGRQKTVGWRRELFFLCLALTGRRGGKIDAFRGFPRLLNARLDVLICKV